MNEFHLTHKSSHIDLKKHCLLEQVSVVPFQALQTFRVRLVLVALDYSLLTQVVSKAREAEKLLVQVKILLYINNLLLNKLYQYSRGGGGITA